MITSILKIFRKQAREHKAIKAFYYNRRYELGSGKDVYPLLWLECPINGRNKDNIFINSVNFSILFTPDSENSVEYFQNLAFSIGLNIIERIKQDRNSEISILPDWSYTTLRDYYDDNAIGCRFSVNFTQRNMQNLCLINEQFSENGQLIENKPIKDFDVNPSNSCEIFVNKFPTFDLKTKK